MSSPRNYLFVLLGFFFALTFYHVQLTLAIKLTSSGPKIIYSTIVRLDSTESSAENELQAIEDQTTQQVLSKPQKLDILAFEEPVDVIERFTRLHQLGAFEKQQLIDHVCSEIECRRKQSEALITNFPLSWFSHIQNEYCSIVIRNAESDLEDVENYVAHHCEVLATRVPNCVCAEVMKQHIIK